MALKFPVRIPFIDLLGAELLRFDGGHAELALTLRDELTNSWGVAHGGVAMTLLDVAMAHAARAPEQPGGDPGPGVATVEMKTTFLRPGTGRLRVQAQLLHRTATLAFCTGSVFDGEGHVASHGSGTFMFLRGLPAGREIRRLNAAG